MSKFLVSAPASTPATTDRVQTQLRPRKHPYTATAYVSTRPLPSSSTSSNVLVVLMAAEAEVVTNGVNGTNGAKANGKVKSKNQLRRLKAKQKKAEQTQTPVRV